MSNKIIVTSAVKLSAEELGQIKTTLHATSTDEVIVAIDPSLIAGIKVTANGQTVDLTVKHQLSEIENN